MQFPVFYCPVPVRINPLRAVVEQRAIQWAADVGLCPEEQSLQRLRDIDAAGLVARLHPDATNIDRLVAVAAWHYWAFALDDARHDTGKSDISMASHVDFSARLVESVNRPGGGGLLGDDRFARAINDLHAQLGRLCSPVQIARYQIETQRWLFGELWQQSNRERRVMPTLSDYIAQRCATGTGVVNSGSEIANDLDISEREFWAPSTRATIEAARLVNCIDNDLHSYTVEYAEQGAGTQTIVAIADIREMATIRTSSIRFFTSAVSQAAKNASPDLLRLFDDLEVSISAVNDWADGNPRYGLSPGSIRITDTMPETPDAPLDIPSIRWWWDTLD
jgi:hypothetical protein